MVDYLEDDPRVRRQEMRDRKEATRPRPRPEPPDEPADERTPSMETVMHRAEALAAVQPPVDAPTTPINDTGKVVAMAKMGGDINVAAGLGEGIRPVGGTTAGKDIGRELDAFLDELGVEEARR